MFFLIVFRRKVILEHRARRVAPFDSNFVMRITRRVRVYKALTTLGLDNEGQSRADVNNVMSGECRHTCTLSSPNSTHIRTNYFCFLY